MPMLVLAIVGPPARHAPLPAACATHPAGANGQAGHQQPSPEDSTTTTSGLQAVAGAAGGAPPPRATQPQQQQQSLPGLSQDQVAELISYARMAQRCADFMRRSTKGFESFLERPDVLANQQAKLVCVHLAAIFMDMGAAPGQRLIQHSREAVRTLCDDLAR